jgi:16S rRNA (uracil1498-N3)-methyltransferase
MHVFFSNQISDSGILLSAEESQHATRVLRMKPGDQAEVLDGLGNRWLTRFEGELKKQCLLSVISKEKAEPRNINLCVALAPTKNVDRYEWFLEKSTELGIETIVPLICQHSERKFIKAERCQKVLIAAMKQSRNAYLPELTAEISFSNFVKQTPETNEQRFIAHCFKNDLPHLKELVKPGKITILIGPEGDFSESEVKMAVENGFKEISLGQSRLRTETAGIVAVHTVALLNP